MTHPLRSFLIGINQFKLFTKFSRRMWRICLFAAGLLTFWSQASALVSVTIDQFDATVLEFTLNGTVDPAAISPDNRNRLVLSDIGNSDWADFFGTATHVSGTTSLTDLTFATSADDSYLGDAVRIERVAPNSMANASFTNYKIRVTPFNSTVPFDPTKVSQFSLLWGSSASSTDSRRHPIVQSTVNVPEPGAYALILGAIGMGFVLIRRNRRKAA